jgi:hypothetical protein
MKNYFRLLVIGFTALTIFGSWWATRNGWSLPRLEKSKNANQYANDCPTWQRDDYGNCPPRTHRLTLGQRDFQDNQGK